MNDSLVSKLLLCSITNINFFKTDVTLYAICFEEYENSSFFPTECNYVFSMILMMNNDYFPKDYYLVFEM
jgi:hypothetical protein